MLYKIQSGLAPLPSAESQTGPPPITSTTHAPMTNSSLCWPPEPSIEAPPSSQKPSGTGTRYPWNYSYTPHALMYGEVLASSSLLWPEGWQTNGRTRCVGWSLCTVPQIKQVSVVIKMTWQMNLTVRANPSLIGTACVTLWRRYWHLPLTDFVLRLLSVLFYAVSVLPTLCYLMWGICPTHPGLFMWKMCLTPHSILCAEYVLHTLCYFMWGVSILCGEFRKRPMLF